jgi:hypothetical protein
MLESRGFICVDQSVNTNSVFAFDSIVLYKKDKAVSISSTLYGITVLLTDQSAAVPRVEVLVNCKEVLTEKDYNKILFRIN